jgi:hypothetical protein
VAAQLGYCGLDRHRQPLAGDEIRPCWEARPAQLPVIHQPPAAAPPGRVFIELDAPAPALPASDERWSLWGDPEA